MYEKFFGLKENPFSLTPDPQYLYMSKVHKEALSHLRYGIEQKKGFVLITGDVGTGKSTICRALLEELPEEVRTALILNPSLSDVELLRAINQEFGLVTRGKSKKALLDSLNEFLLDVVSKGGNAVLIIDECQNLDPNVLEQVRMLSNLETQKEKLLQILMIGQPELAEILSSKRLRQINDRITLRYHMGPIPYSEVKDYIEHRLTVAGSHGDIKFTRSAIKAIFAFSKGLPRRINAVADRAMLIAALKNIRKIYKNIVTSAITEIKGEHPTYRVFPRWIALTLVLVIVVTLGLAMWQESLFSNISSDISSIFVNKPNDTSQDFTVAPQGLDVDDSSIWIIEDYSNTFQLLSAITGGIRGPDMLNLHPTPEVLKDIDRPFIASVEGGYSVVVGATKDYVSIVTSDRALLEIPIDKFESLYRWNIMVTYKKIRGNTIYRLSDTGYEIAKIQSILYDYGYISKGPDGIYDIETVKGIEKIQEIFGLRRDGIVGPDTLALLDIIGNRR
ncbi:MAG: AAA family ATPase [Deltaproteobacteria bacterium]|nr:AAA family ATPase [Deltaproteobacteria bacterium]